MGDDERVRRIKIYIEERKEWQKGVKPYEVTPQTTLYERFTGHRGDKVKKAVDRIARGDMTEEEKIAEEEKTKVSLPAY